MFAIQANVGRTLRAKKHSLIYVTYALIYAIALREKTGSSRQDYLSHSLNDEIYGSLSDPIIVEVHSFTIQYK